MVRKILVITLTLMILTVVVGCSDGTVGAQVDGVTVCAALSGTLEGKVYGLDDGSYLYLEGEQLLRRDAEGEKVEVIAAASAVINVVTAGDVNAAEESWVIYASLLQDEVDTELIARSLSSGREINLGAATTYEWAVNAVWFDPYSKQWLLTAAADLTEVVVRYSFEGDLLGSEEPYPYNDGRYLYVAFPAGDGLDVHLEAPGDDIVGWDLILYVDGELRDRLRIGREYGQPTGVINPSDRATGTFFVETEDMYMAVNATRDGLRVEGSCPQTKQ